MSEVHALTKIHTGHKKADCSACGKRVRIRKVGNGYWRCYEIDLAKHRNRRVKQKEEQKMILANTDDPHESYFDNALRHLREGTAKKFEQKELAEVFRPVFQTYARELTTDFEWWDSTSGEWKVEHHFQPHHMVIARKRLSA